MKQTGVLFIIFLFLCSVSFAQRFNATIIGGVSTTQISGDQLSGFNKAGIVAGAGVFTAINDKWEIEMQMTFMQKGSRKNARPDKNDFEYYLLRLNYFEIPLLFNYTQADKMRFEFGPSAGILLFDFEESQDGLFIGRKQFDDIDISISVGMMYELLDNLYLNTRYSNSVLAVRGHNSNASYRLDNGQYNMVLMFALKYYMITNK